MNIQIDKLEAVISDLKNTLKDALLSTEVWDRQTGLSLCGYKSQPVAVALFTEITNNLSGALTESGFPGLHRYYFMELAGNHTVLVICHGEDILQGILMNSLKINLGILLSVALPKTLDGVAKARS
jgi:hypothetical protein